MSSPTPSAKSDLPVRVSAFYKFEALAEERARELIAAIVASAEMLDVQGLVLVACEGINGTVAGAPDAIEQFKAFLRQQPEFSDLVFKDSPAKKIPFRRLAVQFREEIVSLRAGIGIPNITEKNRLSPAEWDRMIQERGEEISIIDTRNDYEVEIGKFRNALDPKMKRFSQFPEYVKNSGIPRERPVLMYCTGGIRCEKAIEEMYAQGYQEVYQLDGGILRYLAERPNSEFEGECFVFDHRVAVDQQLNPTDSYHLCPHCGNPGTVVTSCRNCEQPAEICVHCQAVSELNSCSKNCAYHLERKARPHS